MIILSAAFLKNTKISGITLFPFIFLRHATDKKNKVLVNHEKIHIRQQVELLVVFFYLWYLAEYFYWYFTLKDSFLAYRYISFEREAFAKETDFGYLRKRKFWSFLKYFGRE